MAVVDLLIDWWRRRRWTQARYTAVRTFPSRSEVPKRLSRRVVGVVDGNPGWIIFECPCGTSHERIELMRTPRGDLPAWRISVDGNRPTIHPSVDYIGGRRCHYWLSEGRVRWV